MLNWLFGLPLVALLAVLALALFLEGTGLPGVVVEPFFLATGILVSAGKATFTSAWLAAALGNFLGALAGYKVGELWLPGLLRHVGPRLGLSPRRLGRAHAWFRRYGAWTVFIGRWFGLIRTPAILLAGSSRLHFGAYAAASAAAALTWTGAYQLAFTLLGRTALSLLAKGAGWLALGLVLALAAAWLGWRLAGRRREREGAEPGEGGAAGPSPGLGRRADEKPVARPSRRARRLPRRPLRGLGGERGLATGRILLLAALALAVLGSPFLYTAYELRADSEAPLPASLLPAPSAATRLLVVAPHPDDETLGAGGIIQRTLAAGGQATVVVLTAGDAFRRAALDLSGHVEPSPRDYLALGERRLGESRAAAAILGLRREDVVLLGFPDQGLLPIWDRFWDPAHPYRSPRTGADRVPYPLPDQGTPYDAPDLVELLWDVVRAARPTVVVAPYPLDGHPDHRAAYDFALFALARAGRPDLPLLTYVVHHGMWPGRLGARPASPLAPPPDLVRRTAWVRLGLTTAEADRKLRAIEAYSSQMRVMGPWLESFARTDEVFSPVREASLARAALELPVLPASLKARLDRGASLVGARVLARDGRLRVELRLAGPPDPRREYRVRLWAFAGGAPQGYLAVWRAGEVAVRPLAPGEPAWPLAQPVTVTADGDVVAFDVPLDRVAPSGAPGRAVLVSVETGDAGSALDRSAFSLASLP
ncbi:MAG: PIG-L family deacetylase [Clostridia bacterium]|nr:PIG-L family deacetylase [Clostridia bacterium]